MSRSFKCPAYYKERGTSENMVKSWTMDLRRKGPGAEGSQNCNDK